MTKQSARIPRRPLVGVAILLVMVLGACAAADETGTIRLATYNVSLSDNTDRTLVQKLREGSNHAKQIAAVVQAVRPDILVLNELDYDDKHEALQLFRDSYLGASQHGQAPLSYPYLYSGPVNTGVPSGLDLDKDNQLNEPEDAFGFGRYPGQYGMALLSRYPLRTEHVRTFQKFLWSAMPDAPLPKYPATGQAFYGPETQKALRLSSKSHWDIPIRIGNRTLHALLAHPTPPGFDGDEDRNGLRNFAEIKLLRDYIDGRSYMTDDQGRRGGLAPEALFFIAGDLNADPKDGGSRDGAIQQLLRSRRVARFEAPTSPGGVAAASAQGQANESHRGDPAQDTADFSDGRVGNLRVDYVLPDARIKVTQTGIFWPLPGDPRSEWIKVSDHRIVWLDMMLPES